MFNVGDIVRPIAGRIGDRYLFKISLIIKASTNKTKDNSYKLVRIHQSLDACYGSVIDQLNEINNVEYISWKEDELEKIADSAWITRTMYEEKLKEREVEERLSEQYIYKDRKGISYQPYEPQPDKPQEIKSKNLFNAPIYNGPLTISTTGTNINNLNRTKITVDNPIYNYYKDLCEKENENMKILKLYNERKSFEINNNYNIKRNELLEKDTIQNIINEMQDQVNALLEEDNMTDARLKIDRTELITKETREKIEKLEVETDKKKDELHASLEEIQALFEMTEDYQERMKILKRYDIIDKNGKLSI